MATGLRSAILGRSDTVYIGLYFTKFVPKARLYMFSLKIEHIDFNMGTGKNVSNYFLNSEPFEIIEARRDFRNS